MTYFAWGLAGLAVWCFFVSKPWPETQLLLLVCLLPLGAYIFLLSKLFGMKKLAKRKKDNTTFQGFCFFICIIGTFCLAEPFVTVVFPWLAQCMNESTLILPAPILAIATIILSIPIMFFALRIAEMVISKKIGKVDLTASAKNKGD
jgi:hypothetical protein